MSSNERGIVMIDPVAGGIGSLCAAMEFAESSSVMSTTPERWSADMEGFHPAAIVLAEAIDVYSVDKLAACIVRSYPGVPVVIIRECL